MSGGGSKETTVGYKYFLGMHMVLHHSQLDKITEIKVDGKTAWTGNAIGGDISVAADNLFGGEEREGGVSGTLEILTGAPNQPKNSYLQSKLGTVIPAFRGVVSVVFKQVYVGMNPYLKPWSFRSQRIHKLSDGSNQWYDAKAQIGNDMNPAHIIRECLTDSLWGMGYGPNDVDDTSFTAAADTLYSEGMGISLLWDKSRDMNDFIGIILSHIQGTLFISRVTGKFMLKLSRMDYNVNSILTLDESSISKISNFKRASIGELINSVTVIYWDATTGKEGSVTVQDISLIGQQGCVVSTTKQYPGFTTGANAVRAASTELRALSTPLASATIYANRKAANLNVGDVFNISWPRYGVVQLTMRVTAIELGTIDNNSVKIEAVEDVFALTTSVYAAPPVTNWVSPISTPQPCQYQFVFDSPYWDIAQVFGDQQAQQLASTASYAQVVGVRPTSDSIFARMYTKNSGSYVESNRLDFCPTALLTNTISYLDTSVIVNTWVDMDAIKAGSYAMIDNEIVAVDSVSVGSITIRRGCLDTVPAIHAAGARIYFVDDYATTDGFEYAQSDVVRFKITPVTGKGAYDVGSASELTAVMGARQAKPYPPGNVRLNSFSYPASITGQLTIDWASRNRLTQTVKPMIDATEPSVTSEPNVTYTLQLYGNGTLRKTVTGLTATNYTWSTESADSGLGVGVYNSSVRIVLKSVRDGIDSLQSYDYTVTRI